MTTREKTADHVTGEREMVPDHIGDAATMIDHAELARLAEAAKRVRRDAIGRLDGDDAHRIWFAFVDAVSNPATVLGLLSEIAALKGERSFLVEQKEGAEDAIFDALTRATQAERQRDELRKALEPFAKLAEGISDVWTDDSIVFDSAKGRLTAGDFRQALANQGADHD